MSVPCINDDTAFLFEVERNEIEGIDDDISSQLSTDDSDSDTDSPYDPYDNDYDEESCNPQAQLSTAVSKVQIKLNNLINNHKASLKLHNDIVNLFNEYIASPNFQKNIHQINGIIIWCNITTSDEYRSDASRHI